MKHRVVAFAFAYLFALVSTNVFAQPAPGGLAPDRGELESASGSNVVFVSYEGPASKIDSLADIKGIGTGLGVAISANAPSASGAAASLARAGDDRRYAVIRAMDPSVKEGLDADIIVVGPDSQVDHIRNLRWIVASYLVAAWGYSEKDASTLATFVTVYNAVHRGDLSYFGSKYKAVVQRELSAENAGLALKYTDWPGKTRMLVPLSRGAKPGSLGAIDTGAISDKAVKDSLKAEPGKGVPDRQALVDVKEREAAQKQAEADRKKAEADAAAAKLAQDRAKAEADRAALEKEKAAAPASTAPANPPSAAGATAAPATAGAGKAVSPNASANASASAAAAAGSASPNASESPNASSGSAGADTGAAPGGGEAAAASLSTKEAAVAAEERKVKEDEKSVAAKKDEAAAAQAAATSKKEEAAADRKEIAADQKEVIAAEVAQKGEAASKGAFLVRVDPATQLGQVLLVDVAKGSVIRASRLNSIHLRSIAQLADSFVAVVGLADKAGGVKLEKIDKASLESIAESKAEAHPDSSVLPSGDSLYAVVKGDDGKYYVAKFAASDLSEKARSKDAVLPFGLISEASGSIAVQAADASFLLLKPDTLEKDKVLKP